MSNQKRLLTATGILAGLLVLLGNYVERDWYRCRVCSTRKYQTQWHLGFWIGASIPLTPKWQRFQETRFSHELLFPEHQHEWLFAQGSPYYFFGTKWAGCAIGEGRHANRFCDMYESNAQFRDFIRAKLQNGSLLKSNLVTLVTNPEQVDAFLQTYPGK